jgi:hypothetical protein
VVDVLNVVEPEQVFRHRGRVRILFLHENLSRTDGRETKQGDQGPML